MFSHHLNDQFFPAEIPQFVQVLDMNMHDPLKPGLGDIHDPPVLDMLPEQHTEIGRRQGALLGRTGQVDQRKGRAGGKQQVILPCFCP